MVRISEFMAVLVILILFTLLALLSVLAEMGENIIGFFIIAASVFLFMLPFSKKTV